MTNIFHTSISTAILALIKNEYEDASLPRAPAAMFVCTHVGVTPLSSICSLSAKSWRALG